MDSPQPYIRISYCRLYIGLVQFFNFFSLN